VERKEKKKERERRKKKSKGVTAALLSCAKGKQRGD